MMPQLQWRPQGQKSHGEKWMDLGTMRDQGRPLWKRQPPIQWRLHDIGAMKTMGGPPRTIANMEYMWPESTIHAACAADGRAREGELLKPLGSRRSWVNLRYQTLSYAAGLWFCLNWLFLCPGYSLLRLKKNKYVTYLDYTVERLWIFKIEFGLLKCWNL